MSLMAHYSCTSIKTNEWHQSVTFNLFVQLLPHVMSLFSGPEGLTGFAYMIFQYFGSFTHV